tara:strand:+ start:27422 stop:27955 length:534 start_codon:yes stop_codon:yes gene_type:complete
MGLSINEIVYTGGSRVFTFNFALGYLNRSDVSVYVQGELDGQSNQLYRTFTWNSDNEIEVTDPITATITAPATVVIQRTVSKDTLVVDFKKEGSATRTNLMFGITQAMMAMHEFIDGRIEPLEDVYPFSEYLNQMIEHMNQTEVYRDETKVFADEVTAAAGPTVDYVQAYIDARDAP